jgi:hypothetical protein
MKKANLIGLIFKLDNDRKKFFLNAEETKH